QSGTPEVFASGEYDADAKTYKLTLKQSSKKEGTLPFHIPVSISFTLESGDVSIPFPSSCFPQTGTFALCQAVASKVLELKEEEQVFTFENVASEPIPSLLR
ncbi:unnamed protein product, partial [Hapterophycus canaliculatus]